MTATLDPAHSRVTVTSISPLRDLAPGSVPALQSTLAIWSTRCDAALADLEAQVEKVKSDAVQREKMRRKKERAIEVQTSDEKGAGKRGPEMRGGFGDDDAMDIDQEGGSGRVTRGAKRGAGTFGFGGTGRRLG